MKRNTYQVCRRCVMDTTSPDIRFDKNGYCNYCTNYLKTAKEISKTKGGKELQRIVDDIKAKRKEKRYDCLIGLSGGVDSSYVAYKVKELGLRPLAFHLDNKWNAEIANDNIKKITGKLGIDLITYTVDWDEFKDLQLSFLKASIPGMEIPTDHALLATFYKCAVEHDIQHIISGSNYSTEGIMAPSWSEVKGQSDWLLIKNIQKHFGKVKLKSYAHFSFADRFYYFGFKKLKVISILDYLPYNKKDVMEIIKKEFGWEYYGGKHYESIYTRFTQAYIQPKKFNIDKRKAHFSSLVCSGQMTREEALEQLEHDAYGDDKLKEKDKKLFLEKLGFSESKFDEIMSLPTKTYLDYPCYTNHPIYPKIFNMVRGVNQGLLKFSFYRKLRS